MLMQVAIFLVLSRSWHCQFNYVGGLHPQTKKFFEGDRHYNVALLVQSEPSLRCANFGVGKHNDICRTWTISDGCRPFERIASNFSFEALAFVRQSGVSKSSFETNFQILFTKCSASLLNPKVYFVQKQLRNRMSPLCLMQLSWSADFLLKLEQLSTALFSHPASIQTHYAATNSKKLVRSLPGNKLCT